MKYIPCTSTDRKYIGKYWTKRQIRGVQCILNATHGIAPTNPSFFKIAFGENIKEFLKIIQMPENYIISRSRNAKNGALKKWKQDFGLMNKSEKEKAISCIADGKGHIKKYTNSNSKILNFLKHYNNEYIKVK